MLADVKAAIGTATCSFLLFLIQFPKPVAGIDRGTIGTCANTMDGAEKGNAVMGEYTLQTQRPVAKHSEDAGWEAKGT